jgi:hypothetical protein
MKAEMAVRSISASISAWAARTAPRTISSVIGSQIRPCAGRADVSSRNMRRRLGRNEEAATERSDDG